MDDRQDAAADALGRIFAGIGERKRLLGAESDPGDKAAGDEQRDGRGKRSEDREDAEQQQVELIYESAAETIAEFTLTGRADEHSENGGAADASDFGPRCELGLKYVRNERAEDGKIDNIEEISSGYEPDNSPMKRRYFRIVQRGTDESLNCLSHGISPCPVYNLCL
jgi:hypothetical protein